MLKPSKIFVLISMIIISSLSNFNVTNAENTSIDGLYSMSAALIDGETGRVLYEKNGEDIRPMASTTKIMTLILALEYGNMDDIVTVSSYAAKMPDVQLGIKEGEQYKLKDLYYSLMLESHNDVAVAIAEHIGGDVDTFALMMNNKAKELGLNNTYFITPNGLDSTDSNGTHSTNAVELGLIMKYCVMESSQKDAFIEICQTREYTFKDYNNIRSYTVENKNTYLDMMEGSIAGKTGFTADAGYCYVAAVKRDGKTLIIALLGCGWPNNKNYKWRDSDKLLNYGFCNYDYTEITSDKTTMKIIEVPDGTPNVYINTYISEYITLLSSDKDNIKLKYRIPSILKPPIRNGDTVGYIDIVINDELYKTINVYASEYTNQKGYDYYLYSLIKYII